MDIIKRMVPARAAKEEITYVAKDGRHFYSEPLCLEYERNLSIIENIPRWNEWVYISSKEEFDAYFYVSIEKSNDSVEYPIFNPDFHLGWITCEYQYDDNGPSKYLLTSAKDLKKDLEELEKIRKI